MYIPGDYFLICDICGFRFRRSQCRMQWNNLLACNECFDEKHPQHEPPKPLGEKQSVPIHRPEQEDVFITTPVTPDDL